MSKKKETKKKSGKTPPLKSAKEKREDKQTKRKIKEEEIRNTII